MFFNILMGLILALLSLLQFSHAGFVELHDIGGDSLRDYLLNEFFIDVAMDTEKHLLKFFINTQVNDPQNFSTTDVLIDDVNVTTNRYTTFHVDIDFMGKTFILENLRFCDMVSVKNTSVLAPSARYPPSDELDSLSSASSTSSQLLSQATRIVSGNEGYVNFRPGKREYITDPFRFNMTNNQDVGLMASSNKSVDAFFNNSTGSLVQCPLYQNDSIVLYYQADISSHRKALGSYNVRFTVVSNNEDLDIIGAAQAHVTPVLHPKYLSSILKYSVLVIIIISGAVNYCITIVSPDQESNNPFLVEASTICNAKLLRELEASTNVIVRYFQFAFFMAGLDLQYPGFYPPFIGQIRWCCLLGLNVFKHTAVPLMESDNVFITLHWSGLSALALYGSSNYITYSWANFIISLTVCIGATVGIHQFFIMLKLFVNQRRRTSEIINADDPLSNDMTSFNEAKEPRKGLYSISKNAWALLGHVLRQFLHTFELAFLVLTFFMFYVASDKGTNMYMDQTALKAKAFSFYIPYFFLSPRCQFEKTKTQTRPQPQGIPKASIICGSLLLLAYITAKLYFVFKYLVSFRGFRFSQNKNVTRLYTEIKSVLLWAYFYNFYLPNKSYYAILDFAALILQLVVVALLQMNGAVQVALLTLLELSRLILLLTISPFYLKMTWHSLHLITPIAKIFVLFLSIPYIRALGIAEAPRTYVAYIQLIVHLVVVLFFICHLIYCVSLTIMSYFSAKERNREKSIIASAVGKADFNEDFEYYPVNYRNFDVTRAEENILAAHISESFDAATADEEEVEYYRAQSDKILQKCGRKVTNLPRNTKTLENEETIVTDLDSFNGIEYQLRRRRNDYATRECDKIYEKFFSSANMDPEIRNLWASRLRNMDDTSGNAAQSTTHLLSANNDKVNAESWTENLLYKVGLKKKPAVKGFEVFRPNRQMLNELRAREADGNIREG